jgi:hypothetical protein
MTSTSTQLRHPDNVRASSPWLAFTGLLPVIVMVPILAVHAYAAGVLVAVGGCLAVLGYHLGRRQGVTSLDALALAFAAVNLVLYFGFDNEWLIKHVAVIFYTLLGAQCVVSLFGTPWTSQFTQRVVRPDFVEDPRFRAMNVRATAIWAAAFAGADVVSLAVSEPTADWLPVVLMALAMVVSRLDGRRFLGRVLEPAT